ncbi:MAG: IS110 family transposase [Alphaproteobacteria bacterium]|jgi:transposase|nr:IS110 family transposase [Alphaproteobacteria bacterium]
MMPQQGRIVGIDVSKAKVDACIRSLRQWLSAPNTPTGERELIAWLHDNRVGLAVMEASGGYERSWAEALRGAGIAVRIVDPKRVRYFARSAGRLAKNDPIDAEMIAWFAETFATEAQLRHDPDRDAVDRLMTARSLLVRLSTQIRQLGQHRQPPVVENAQRAMIKAIKAQLAKLEAAIEVKIRANAELAARAAIIRSVPGFGRQFVAGVLAWLPELGGIGNKAAAALVGIAPYDDDSGQHRGQRHIKGGRREIRDLLYMATLAAASRHNPVIKAYYQRLRAKGKKAKVALVACMRKLIVILNTLLARGQMWNPPSAAASVV